MCLVLRNINKSYNDKPVLKDVNMTFEQCGMYFIKGVSGSGKTTLLNIIAGIEDFDSGERQVHNDLCMTYIFQNFELIDSLNVRDNIFFSKIVFNQDNDQANMIIEKLGLSHLLEHYPYELSHGQKQRVAIARSLLQNASVILCDEPTESLDKKNKDVVMNLLKILSQDHIVIVVSHDETLMNTYYDFCYEIKDCYIMNVANRGEHARLKKHQTSLQLNHHAFIQLFMKMLYKKHIFSSSLICLLLGVMMIVIQMNFQFFQNYDSIGAYNDHVIYVESNYDERLEKNYNQYYSEIRPQFEFQNKPLIQDNKIDVNLCSIPSYVHDMSFIAGQEGGVIINQFTADKIQETLHIDEQGIIGLTVELTYEFLDYSHVFEFEITGIVQEYEQLYNAQLYYPYESIYNVLKTETIHVNEQDISVLDAIGIMSGKYEVIYDLDKDMVEEFERLQNDDYLLCSNIYLEQIMFTNQQSHIIQLAFLSMIIILFIVSVVYLIYTSYQTYLKEYYYFVILNTLNIPFKLMDMTYFGLRMILFIFVFMIAYLGHYIIYKPLASIVSHIVSIEIQSYQTLSMTYVVLLFFIFLLIHFITLFVARFLQSRQTVSSQLKEAND